MSLTVPCSRARGLEQLLLAGAHGPLAHLALDDLQPLGDLLLVGAGAVAAEQELADVGRHGVLALELAAPGPCGRCSPRRPRRPVGPACPVPLVVSTSIAYAPDGVAACARTSSARSSTTTNAPRPPDPRPRPSSETCPSASTGFGRRHEGRRWIGGLGADVDEQARSRAR